MVCSPDGIRTRAYRLESAIPEYLNVVGYRWKPLVHRVFIACHRWLTLVGFECGVAHPLPSGDQLPATDDPPLAVPATRSRLVCWLQRHSLLGRLCARRYRLSAIARTAFTGVRTRRDPDERHSPRPS